MSRFDCRGACFSPKSTFLSQPEDEKVAKKSGYHVVPNGDEGWALRRGGSQRATSLHSTQAEAIEAGRQHAINQGAELVIHRPNGQIRDSDSYGNDPMPPRDEKH
jgi:hypothetical protein